MISFDEPSGCVLALYDDDACEWVPLASADGGEALLRHRLQFGGLIRLRGAVEEAASHGLCPEAPGDTVAAAEPVATAEPVVEHVGVDPLDALRASEAVVACLQAEVARQGLINDAQGALLRATRLLARDDEL